MDTTYNNNVVLVTGGAKRIGAAICKRFHREGWRIIVHCHTSLVEAELLAAELNEERPDSVMVVKGALNSSASCSAIATQSIRCFGRVDALVNNASDFSTDATLEGEREWNSIFEINTYAPYHLSLMLHAELALHRGCIINMLDVRATNLNPYPGWDIYYASKAALHALTLSTAKAFAPAVRVNGVSPGITLPLPGEERHAPEMDKRSLLDKTASADDIADAAYWLSNAKHATGQVVTIDGGESLRW